MNMRRALPARGAVVNGNECDDFIKFSLMISCPQGSGSYTAVAMLRIFLLLAALVFPCWAGPMMSVSDTQGRALEIELLALNGDSVRFRRVDTGKEFEVAIDLFDDASRKKIRTEAKDLPPMLPPLEVEAVIGKRRSKGDSYYMMTQTISCTMKLRNRSHNIALPPLTARVFFIGQNQRNPGTFTMLSVQDFEVELEPGGSSETPLEPFITRYDSDNKGYGNIGGYQYSGYLMLLLNDKKEVVFHYTTDPKTRKAVDGRPTLLAKIAEYPKGCYINEKMEQMNMGMGAPQFVR
jgi:hypothetical protein